MAHFSYTPNRYKPNARRSSTSKFKPRHLKQSSTTLNSQAAVTSCADFTSTSRKKSFHFDRSDDGSRSSQPQVRSVETDAPDADGVPPVPSALHIPSKIHGKLLHLMVDTGCTNSILSKHFFDRLPASIRSRVRTGHLDAILVDGSRAKMYGQIRLTTKLRSVKKDILYQIARIDQDAILGLDVLQQGAEIDVGNSILQIDGKKLTCTDKLGNPLSSKVQVHKDQQILPLQECSIKCRLTSPVAGKIGLVESLYTEDSVMVAACLVRPDGDQIVPVRCFNPSSHPVHLKSGKIIGSYVVIDDRQVAPSAAPKIATVKSRLEAGEKTSQTGCNDNPVPVHVTELYQQATLHCKTPQECESVAKLLNAYSDVFSSGSHDTGRTTLVSHSIELEAGSKPIKQPPRRLGPARDQEVQRQVDELLAQGRIEPHDGAWSSPVVLVGKKDKTWRLCVDYRRLNAVTRKDAYPLPRIDESLDSLAGSRYFSTLDLLAGYWQVPLDPAAQDKSAFVTRSGLWRWNVLPFGLTTAVATFQRLMEKVLTNLQWKTLLLYLDDVIVFAPTFQQHLERLQEVLTRFRAAGLKLKPSKCELFTTKVSYLGHIVSKDGISTDPKKLDAVENWPVPKCTSEVRSFLGFLGYYRRFVPDFATLAKPLSLLTSKSAKFEWGVEQQRSFEVLRQRMLTAPVLAYPDTKGKFVVDTDASADGLGAVLSQIQNGEEKVIAYWSKTLAPAERNYCVTRKELLAVVAACKHFRAYLYGQDFKLRTDHASLIWLCKRREAHGQIARWLEILSEFTFTIEHRKGSRHANADALSRQRCLDCRKCKLIEARDGGPSREQIVNQLDSSISQPTPFPLEGGAPLADQGATNTHLSALRANVTSKINFTELAELQQQRPSELAVMYDHVRDNTELTADELASASGELKQLNQLRHKLTIDEHGVLRISLRFGNRTRKCAICPKQWRRDVIWETHSLIHGGINRTEWRLKLNWFWYSMRGEIRRQINACGTCQLAKHARKTVPTSRQRLYAGRPWEVVAIDLVGPFQKTCQGHTMVLVLADHFTRWRDAIPLKDGTTVSVARALQTYVFPYFGLPAKITSDNGSQFESDLMHELCTLWGVEKGRISAYTPEANGICEKGNRDLGDSLRSLIIGADEDEWDNLLPAIMQTIRATPHTSTGETPNYMMFGRELRLPDQLVYGAALEKPVSRQAYAIEIGNRLEKVHSALRDKQLQIRTTDRDEPAAFKEGSYVLMKNKRHRKGQTAKLQPKYVGPYRVVQCFPNKTYKICRDGQVSIEGERRLKQFIGPLDPRAEVPVILEPVRRQTMAGRPPVLRKQPVVLDHDAVNRLIDKRIATDIDTTAADKRQDLPAPKHGETQVESEQIAILDNDYVAATKPARATVQRNPQLVTGSRKVTATSTGTASNYSYEQSSAPQQPNESTSKVWVVPKMRSNNQSPTGASPVNREQARDYLHWFNSRTVSEEKACMQSPTGRVFITTEPILDTGSGRVLTHESAKHSTHQVQSSINNEQLVKPSAALRGSTSPAEQAVDVTRSAVHNKPPVRTMAQKSANEVASKPVSNGTRDRNRSVLSTTRVKADKLVTTSHPVSTSLPQRLTRHTRAVHEATAELPYTGQSSRAPRLITRSVAPNNGGTKATDRHSINPGHQASTRKPINQGRLIETARTVTVESSNPSLSAQPSTILPSTPIHKETMGADRNLTKVHLLPLLTPRVISEGTAATVAQPVAKQSQVTQIAPKATRTSARETRAPRYLTDNFVLGRGVAKPGAKSS